MKTASARALAKKIHIVLYVPYYSLLTLQAVIERVDAFSNGSCISDDNILDKNIYMKKFNASYSRQACRQIIATATPFSSLQSFCE